MRVPKSEKIGKIRNVWIGTTVLMVLTVPNVACHHVAAAESEIWPYRLVVRIVGLHPIDTGSTPVAAAI